MVAPRGVVEDVWGEVALRIGSRGGAEFRTRGHEGNNTGRI
jgi:hypothetical protein